MPKRIHPLTDIQARKAKPREKNFKMADGNGLYLLVTTSGGGSFGGLIIVMRESVKP